MKQEYHSLYLEKAKELVAKMTVEEKTSQLCSEAPAIERLGIPSYHWWNEGLHGVARAGIATIFRRLSDLRQPSTAERLPIAVASRRWRAASSTMPRKSTAIMPSIKA